MVQGLDMGIRDFQEFIIAEIGKQHMTGECEVGAIKLQIQSGGDDGFVFRLHRIGERSEVLIAAGIEIVLQKTAR